eukprot:215083-Amphidinium_carterae.2
MSGCLSTTGVASGPCMLVASSLSVLVSVGRPAGALDVLEELGTSDTDNGTLGTSAAGATPIFARSHCGTTHTSTNDVLVTAVESTQPDPKAPLRCELCGVAFKCSPDDCLSKCHQFGVVWLQVELLIGSCFFDPLSSRISP